MTTKSGKRPPLHRAGRRAATASRRLSRSAGSPQATSWTPRRTKLASAGVAVAAVATTLGVLLPTSAHTKAPHHESQLLGASSHIVTRSAATPVVQPFGNAPHESGPKLAGPVVGIARTADGRGYWIATSSGAVIARGDARNLGNGLRIHHTQPFSGIAATTSGQGFWLVARGGGVYAFGDARTAGDLAHTSLSAPVVGIASAGTAGYWLTTSNGRVWAFGTARSLGNPASQHLAHPVVGISPSADNRGYLLATSNGSVFAYGDARFDGSLPQRKVSGVTVTGIAAASNASGGYWMLTSAGRVYCFNTACHGSVSEPSDRQAVALASSSDGQGYWALSGGVTPKPVVTKPTMTPIGTFNVTCYDNHGITRSGAYTTLNTVAVDPAQIPMGTTIYVGGVAQLTGTSGTRIAQDTGGLITWGHLDIWMPTYNQCIAWGRRYEPVWIVHHS